MTDPEILQKLIDSVRNYKMTPDDKFRQKVSFVYGQQDYDSPIQWTKRQVAEFIAEHQGYPAEWAEGVRD
jgi:hypothetical protein